MHFSKFVLFLSLSLTGVAMAHGKENLEPDAQAVDAACVEDATKTNCTNEKVGTGLLKCLHAYKRANPTFTFTEACHTAMHKLHQDHKAKK